MDCKCTKCQNSNITDLKSFSKIEKPWGYEIIWAQSKGSYLGKILFVRKGERLSLQHHKEKTETMMLTEGKIKLTFGESLDSLQEFLLEKDSVIHIEPETIHRVYAEEDALIVEVSSYYPTDVIRHQDDYKR